MFLSLTDLPAAQIPALTGRLCGRNSLLDDECSSPANRWVPVKSTTVSIRFEKMALKCMRCIQTVYGLLSLNW